MTSTAVAITIAAAMVLPIFGAVATADHGTWILGSGSYEPSTAWDDDPLQPVMFTTPNHAAAERAYLNGVIVHHFGAGAGVNAQPNLDGGSVTGAAANYVFAYLGFWRDCNEDGYVGSRAVPHSAGSLTAYPRVGAAIDTTICPLGSVYNPINVATNAPDALIDEFRWIGPSAGCDPWEQGCPGTPTYNTAARLCVPPSNPNSPACVESPVGRLDTNGWNDVTDNRSRMWGDWNFPGGSHVPSQGISPTPRGTFQDSDGTLKYVDDAVQREISRAVGPAWSTKPVIGRCDQPHPVFLGGSQGSRLPVGDRSTCGLWPMFQVYRLYNDSTCLSEDPAAGRPQGCAHADPLVTAFDTTQESGNDPSTPCDDAFRTEVALPPTMGGTRTIGVPNVQPGINPNILADGSIQGTVNHVYVASNGTATQLMNGRCGRESNAPNQSTTCVPYTQFECDAAASVFTHVAPDHQFNFTAATSNHALASYGFYSVPRDSLGNGNLLISASLVNTNTPGWFSDNAWTHRPPRMGWGYTVNTYLSIYADVTSQALVNAGLGASFSTAVPGAADDRWTYGLEACPAITTGTSNVNPANQWECSKTVWEAFRASLGVTGRWDAVLGEKYDLRDVDCYDNTVVEEIRVAGIEVTLSDVKAGTATCGAVH